MSRWPPGAKRTDEDAGTSPPASRDGAGPSRMLIQWHVTERCNLRCDHCYQDDVAAPAPTWEGWLATLERIEGFLARCRARRPGGAFRSQLTLTGGEPFVHLDFMRLLERVARVHRFAVLTNGTLVDRPLARALGRLRPTYVQVSVDGGPQVHDRIRGPGSHERAVAGLRHLVAAGVPAHVSFTVRRSNRHELPAVARLGRRLGVARVWADRLVPWGRADAAEVLGPEETRAFVRVMATESRRGWPLESPLTLHRALQFAGRGGCPYRCAAGRTLLAVLPDGGVLPCRRLPVPVGNLHETPLERIYATSPVLRALRGRRHASAGCERCFYSETCGGGLRCLAYALHRDPFRADPGCWMATHPSPAAAPAGAPPTLVPVES
jgi:radical SAM protein with 4Fe4S-binding SPASM domain